MPAPASLFVSALVLAFGYLSTCSVFLDQNGNGLLDM